MKVFVRKNLKGWFWVIRDTRFGGVVYGTHYHYDSWEHCLRDGCLNLKISLAKRA